FSSTLTLKDLVNDILDFSKIESGELDLAEEHFNLDELLQQVVNIMSVNARAKGLEFVYEGHDVKDFEFFGDSARVRQILINLIGNAIKFTEKGSVRVKAHIDEDEKGRALRVDVTDT